MKFDRSALNIDPERETDRIVRFLAAASPDLPRARHQEIAPADSR